MRSKKSQLFLLAAMIIMFTVYSLVIVYNSAEEIVALEDYEDLTENYLTESPKVFNKELADTGSEEQASKKVNEFTTEFKQYANEKDPNFGILKVFMDSNGIVHIVNMLSNKEIKIEYCPEEYTKDGGYCQDGTEIELKIGSDSNSASGTISLDNTGLPGINFDTNLGQFGEDLYSKETTAQSITIKIDGVAYQISLKEFNNNEIITSEKVIGSGGTIAKVTLNQI